MTLFCVTHLDVQVKLYVQTQQKIMQICREVDRPCMISISLPTKYSSKYLTTEDENSAI